MFIFRFPPRQGSTMTHSDLAISCLLQEELIAMGDCDGRGGLLSTLEDSTGMSAANIADTALREQFESERAREKQLTSELLGVRRRMQAIVLKFIAKGEAPPPNSPAIPGDFLRARRQQALKRRPDIGSVRGLSPHAAPPTPRLWLCLAHASVVLPGRTWGSQLSPAGRPWGGRGGFPPPPELPAPPAQPPAPPTGGDAGEDVRIGSEGRGLGGGGLPRGRGGGRGRGLGLGGREALFKYELD